MWDGCASCSVISSREDFLPAWISNKNTYVTFQYFTRQILYATNTLRDKYFTRQILYVYSPNPIMNHKLTLTETAPILTLTLI
jgi:hypothetical protein